MERNFKGIWIPKEIWLSEELTLQEKVMLVEIDSLDNEDLGCYASNKYFSKFFKLTTQRVSQIINALATKGFISVTYEYQGKEIDKRILRINRPPYPEIEVSNKIDTYQENFKGGIKYSREGYQENFKENNITMNNISNNINKENAKRKFSKPTLEEINQYCLERNNGINAEAFYDFYESKDWYVGKNKMKDWKACVRTWERREETSKGDKQQTKFKSFAQREEERFERLKKELLEEE